MSMHALEVVACMHDKIYYACIAKGSILYLLDIIEFNLEILRDYLTRSHTI